MGQQSHHLKDKDTLWRHALTNGNQEKADRIVDIMDLRKRKERKRERKEREKEKKERKREKREKERREKKRKGGEKERKGKKRRERGRKGE